MDFLALRHEPARSEASFYPVALDEMSNDVYAFGRWGENGAVFQLGGLGVGGVVNEASVAGLASCC